MAWAIREAAAADLRGLPALDEGPGGWRAAAYAGELAEPTARLLLATPVAGGAAAAAIAFRLVADEVQLLQLAVAAEHRRQGLARALLTAMVRASRTHGAIHVTLEVRRGNVAARALYRGAGLHEVGLRRGYYGADGEDALLLGGTAAAMAAALGA